MSVKQTVLYIYYICISYWKIRIEEQKSESNFNGTILYMINRQLKREVKIDKDA